MSSNGIAQYASDADAMRTWSSIGGCDIIAVFNGVECGSIQAISVSVSREKMPNYTMGRADPVGFSRGKRGIAGSMVGIVFNQSWLMHTIRGNTTKRPAHDTPLTFFAGHREHRQFLRVTGAGTVGTDPSEEANRRLVTGQAGGDVTFYTGRTRQQAWYADQILPFNIVITGANEYGGGVAKSIVGVEILNEATGVSVDDIMIDESHTYIALGVTPWMGLEFKNPKTGNGIVEDRAVDEILSQQGLNQSRSIFSSAGN